MAKRFVISWRKVILVAFAGLFPWSAGAVAPTSARAQETIRIEQANSTDLPAVLEEGRTLEASRDWAGALAHYEEALRTHRGDPALLERYDLAKLHYSLGRRYTDRSYLKTVEKLSPEEAYQVFAEVVTKLHTHYVDTPPWGTLMARGNKGLDVALADATFRQHNLTFADTSRVDGFRREIYYLADARTVQGRREAAIAVANVARAAEAQLGMNQAAIYLEYVAAIVGGLDDYSAFLTPDQLKDQYAQIEGNFVGLGVELKAEPEGLLIVKVIRGSPAARAGILDGDHVTSVDGVSTIGITTDQAANMLAGEQGSRAQLKVVTRGQNPRTLTVLREQVEVPSIDEARIIDPHYGVAYVRLPTFQKTTSRDLEAALWELHGKGMKHLILDLRGNPGGLLNAAVEVVDKFVQQGSILATRGRSAGENFDFSANRIGTWRVPLTVLIDRDSASASEIFAGAIRDHRRGTLVGESSYGKGSVQGIFALGAGGSGLRLTTAKFYSPSGRPISGVGVQPDIEVRQAGRPTSGGDQIARISSDAVLESALQAARRQLASR